LRAWWTSLTERSDVLAAGFAAAGLCFLALIIFELLEPGSPEFPSQRIETARGGQGAVALSDGSQLTLGADTRVLVRFSGGARRLVLERGEARFKVHHDRQHPFVVEAGAGSITAVGTEFVVRRYSTYSHSVRLWVTEGAVEVAPDSVRPNVALSAAEQRLERVRVVQGEGMTYNGEKHTEPTRSADSDLSSELVKGAFLYRGRPLAEVIEDVQRYSVRKIALDPSAGDLRYSGIVLQKNVDQWLRGLPEIFPGLVIEDSADAILIRSAVHGAQAAAKAVIG
jgi:transmembrane sensor